MKKLFMTALFLMLNSKPVCSMEVTFYDVPKNLEILDRVKIEQLIKNTYLDIPFPKVSSKDVKKFIEQIGNKELILCDSKPSFEQLNFLLSLAGVYQPKLKTLDLSGCELTTLPDVLKEMKNLESIDLSYNKINTSEFNKLPTSLKKLTHSLGNTPLPNDLINIELIVIIPMADSNIIDL